MVALPSVTSAPVPEGWYRVEVQAAEVRTDRSGNAYLALRLTLLDLARPVHVRLFVGHKVRKYRERDRRVLVRLYQAAGIPFWSASEERLVGATVRAHVTTRPGEGLYAVDTVVSDFARA